LGRDFKLSPAIFKASFSIAAAIGSLGASGFTYLGFIGTSKVLYGRSLIARDSYNKEMNLANQSLIATRYRSCLL
jgi:hypothetical protein